MIAQSEREGQQDAGGALRATDHPKRERIKDADCVGTQGERKSDQFAGLVHAGDHCTDCLTSPTT